MARNVAMGSCLLLLMTGILRAQDGDKDLDGAYSVVLMQDGNQVAPKELIQKAKFIFKGNTLLIVIKGDSDDTKKAKITVGADKTPRTIDISPTEGNEKGKTFPGIYKVEKGEVTLAFTEKPGAERPKDFKSEENVILIKLKKE